MKDKTTISVPLEFKNWLDTIKGEFEPYYIVLDKLRKDRVNIKFGVEILINRITQFESNLRDDDIVQLDNYEEYGDIMTNLNELMELIK